MTKSVVYEAYTRPASAADWLIDIEQGKPFSFSRWGDGEFTCLFDRAAPRNCDGHAYTDGLRDALWRALTEQRGPRLGLQNLACQMMGGLIGCTIREHELGPWFNADLFHLDMVAASNESRLWPMVSVIRNHSAFRTAICVGPDPFAFLLKPIGFDVHIPVSRVNCWQDYEKTVGDLRRAIENHPKPALVSFSCSMPANVMVHELFRDYGAECWLLDLGSVWLSYLPDGHGIHIRSYQRGARPFV